ncbi:hypothetical protein V8E55_008523 [Tylopilus felleus]
MFAKALAVLVLPFLAQFVFADNTCSRTYTVQDGDICDSISAAQNVSTYQLAVVNEGVIDTACDNLQPNSSICLGWEGEDCDTTYVVQLGDTCDDIYAAQSINATLLYGNNPQINPDCTNIYVGEVLCVADSVEVPPTPTGTMPAATIPPTGTPATTDLPYCDEL